MEEDPNAEREVKIVLVGDTNVGKSCLIYQFDKGIFSEDYEPTVLDIFRGPRAFEGKQITLEIHDTSGDENLGINRQVSYNNADCFMVCVAVNNRTSLENVGKWQTEIRQVRPEAPILLVGTKSDMRSAV